MELYPLLIFAPKAREMGQKPKGLRSLPETSPLSERSTVETPAGVIVMNVMNITQTWWLF